MLDNYNSPVLGCSLLALVRPAICTKTWPEWRWVSGQATGTAVTMGVGCGKSSSLTSLVLTWRQSSCSQQHVTTSWATNCVVCATSRWRNWMSQPSKHWPADLGHPGDQGSPSPTAHTGGQDFVMEQSTPGKSGGSNCKRYPNCCSDSGDICASEEWPLADAMPHRFLICASYNPQDEQLL